MSKDEKNVHKSIRISKSTKYLIIRAVWYLAGFVLLFAPLALFQKFLIKAFNLAGKADIHGACFRMFVQKLFTGNISTLSQILTTSGIISLLVLLSAAIFGPFFCGKLCTAGAIPEYLGRIVPDKLKLDLQKHINGAPVRYGLLASYLLTPFIGLSVACAYCNYSFVQKLVLGGTDIGVLGSTAILTAILWLALGIFIKGGRGYCTYLCPIGAIQNLLHFVGSKFSITWKLKFNKSQCVNCNLCVKDCPTRSLQQSELGLQYNIHTCNTCLQCKNVCPKSAITYGQGKGNWNTEEHKTTEVPKVTV